MAASDCNTMSMEVKDLVITVLFSSAACRMMWCEESSSMGVSVPQVIARTLRLSTPSKYLAACRISDVCPERVIMTGWQGTGSSCGKSIISDAVIARDFSPVRMNQLAAALCAKKEVETQAT